VKEVRLKDLYICAFLINEKQNLIRMENDGIRCWFVFEQTTKLDALIESYWQDKAFTKVKSYVNKIRDLKDRIFSEK